MQSCKQNSWGKPHSYPVGTPLELTYNAETKTLKITRNSLPALTTPFSVIPGTAGKDGKNGINGDKGDPGIVDTTNPAAIMELMTAIAAHPNAVLETDLSGNPIGYLIPA